MTVFLSFSGGHDPHYMVIFLLCPKLSPSLGRRWNRRLLVDVIRCFLLVSIVFPHPSTPDHLLPIHFVSAGECSVPKPNPPSNSPIYQPTHRKAHPLFLFFPVLAKHIRLSNCFVFFISFCFNKNKEKKEKVLFFRFCVFRPMESFVLDAWDPGSLVFLQISKGKEVLEYMKEQVGAEAHPME